MTLVLLLLLGFSGSLVALVLSASADKWVPHHHPIEPYVLLCLIINASGWIVALLLSSSVT